MLQTVGFDEVFVDGVYCVEELCGIYLGTLSTIAQTLTTIHLLDPRALAGMSRRIVESRHWYSRVQYVGFPAGGARRYGPLGRCRTPNR